MTAIFIDTSELPGGPVHLAPTPTDLDRAYWCGGVDGHLHILRCHECRRYVHPPRPRCPWCHARQSTSEPVSGRGQVYTVTVNHHPWGPGQQVPYAVAIVELDEQPGLRLTTNIVTVPPDAIWIGMPVAVRFVPMGDVYLPVFAPAERP